MMTQVYALSRIKDVLEDIDLVQAIEDGFVDYSRGRVVVPPVGELVFKDPPGDTHIKYGYILDDDYFVIKIASGFYENVKLGLPAMSGLMLVFKQKTGELAAILLDEGHLTNLRTAAAGAVVAKYLAPAHVHRIGVFGAGTQGRLQVEFLESVVSCKDVIVWGIDDEELGRYKDHMESRGYAVETTRDSEAIASSANLIVTATPSKKPLLDVGQIRAGTHITAMGSDTPEKIELDPKILGRADIVVADSLSQCLLRGEIHRALDAGELAKEDVIELGNVILEPGSGRSSEEQITVADLTGVAVQDIQISKAVYRALIERER
jgi:ornithine cyclodeaminase